MPIGFNHNSHNVNQSEEIVLQIGSIFGNGRSNAPSGYLLCDGSAVSRTTYANLFNAISTSFGVGDGSTTFNIPDMRQAVPRGVGTNSFYNANVTVVLGERINDTLETHSHSIPIGYMWNGNIWNHGTNYTNDMTPTIGTNNNSGRSSTETRMKNIGINFFIKF